MQSVILAAGKGKRLSHFTIHRSKALAPILGKSIAERVIDDIAMAGINDFVVVVSPQDKEIVEIIQKYAEEKQESNQRFSIKFVTQYERLGMANALDSAKDLITGDFLLSACDTLISAEFIKDMVAKFNESGNFGVLGLMKVSKERIPKTGIVAFNSEDKISHVVEKPSIEEAPSDVSSIPVYVFNNEIFKYLPKVPLSKRGEYELQDAIDMLIKDKGPLDGVYTNYRLDLTSLEDLLKINLQYLSTQKDDVILSEIPKTTEIISPIFIDKHVLVGEFCTIGPNVYLEPGVEIKNGCKIQNSVIIRDTKIPENSEIDNEIRLPIDPETQLNR